MSTPGSSAFVSRPYKCSICELSFGRSEHLDRHVKIHTGEKRYQCPCGTGFFRSDVLSRHVRKCKEGYKTQERLAEVASKPRTRKKTACDKCAKAKSRCDALSPCTRCCRQSLPCTYTREGRHELYSSYIIVNESPAAAPDGSDVIGISETSPTTSNAHSYGSSDEGWQSTEYSQSQTEAPNITAGEIMEVPNGHSPLDRNPFCDLGVDALTSDLEYILENTLNTESVFQLFNMTGMFQPFEPLPTLSKLSNDCHSANIVDNLREINPSATDDHPNYPQYPQAPRWSGFSLEQMDPIEFKCGELKDLLKGSDPLIPNTLVLQFVTRENILLFGQLYGMHFQQNFPILHMPSFKLFQTPPLLLFAIMIAGAWYSENRISSNHIDNLAMRLLMLIESQPHEIQMELPPISAIQASAIACSILVRSRGEIASKFVCNYFSRNISMIKRTCIFDLVDLTGYSHLTEHTFDWQEWIEQESLRRIACEIFCHDMAGCIFQGNSPSISPLDFHVQLPSYESCWEATTASECLKQLQNVPQQIRLSTAIRRLGASAASNEALFEASGFGMFVIIKGLHCLLFQATKYDIDTPPGKFDAQNAFDIDSLLSHEPLGPTVAALADKAISANEPSALQNVNKALNAWRSTWDLRLFREMEHENHTFFNDPLPFWWLAKLYIFLHHYAHLSHGDSEFSTPRVVCSSNASKLEIQGKIVRWFSKFRQQQHVLEQHTRPDDISSF